MEHRAHNAAGEKWCNKCSSHRPLDDFHNCSTTWDKKACWCKMCHRRAKLETYTRRRYGLELSEYAMLIEAGCAICGDSAVHLDHCHASGGVREALCQACNFGLGHFKDDPARLKAAARYIEKHA